MKALLHSTRANPSLSPVVHEDLLHCSRKDSSRRQSHHPRGPATPGGSQSSTNTCLKLSCTGTAIRRRASTNPETIATGFLANVVREDPLAHTRGVAAKRAINLLRALAKKSSLDDNIAIKYLARGVKKAIVRTKRQSPALLAVYVAAIVRDGVTTKPGGSEQLL